MENKLTVGVGTPEERDILVVDGLKALYAGGRLISVVELEDGSYCISVQNTEDSGRQKETAMWLSKESFLAVLSSCSMFMDFKKFDVLKEMDAMQKGENVIYRFLSEEDE